ncbi:MAG: ACP phosphodiesterase [Bacteroidota bacterium]
MNYLGHAFLSFGDEEILTGNMIADHVKGKIALEAFPAGIRKGIELHRKIDGFTDTHPATKRAKVWFRADYRLYSGAIMDSLYDHYLANDPKLFANEAALLDFSKKTYTILQNQSEHFPQVFANYFPYMRKDDWLYNYRTMKGMDRSLHGLERRAKYIPPVDNAYKTFVIRYYEIAQCYYEFIDDVIKFVKLELGQ